MAPADQNGTDRAVAARRGAGEPDPSSPVTGGPSTDPAEGTSGPAGTPAAAAAPVAVSPGSPVSPVVEPAAAGEEQPREDPAAPLRPRFSTAQWSSVAVGAAAVLAVLVVHLLAALRADRAIATVGEAQLAAAAAAARGIDVVADPLPPSDLLAARQLAALQVLLPTDGVAAVDAARWACLAAGAVVALLLWGVQRSLGLARPAAAVGVLVAGALPPAVAVHAGVTAAAPAALWLAAAALLVIRMQGRGVRPVLVAAGLALVAVLTAPLLAAAVIALGAHAILDRSVLASLPGRARIAAGALLGALALVAVLLTVGDGPLAGVGGPLLGEVGAVGCALLGAVVLGVGWWRARWLRPLLSPAVLLLAVVLLLPGPSRAAAAVLVIPVLALGAGVLVDELSGRWWVAPGALLAAAATVLAGIVSAPQAPGGPPGAGVAALAGWARTELDPGFALRADALDRAELVAAGIPGDRLRGPADPSGPDEVLVVSARPATGDTAPARCPIGDPLAATGRGAGGAATTVCPAPEAAGALDAERADRIRAGTGLAANPALQLPPAAAAVLRAGRVDSRLVAVLAELSSTHPVAVADFPTGPLDVAGTPLRWALLTGTGTDAAGLRAWSADRPGPLAPAVVEPAGEAVLVGFPAPGRPGLLPG